MKKWSQKFDKCQKCGTTERKHNALGLCSKCYVHQQYQRPHIKAYRDAKKKLFDQTKKGKTSRRRLNRKYYYTHRKELTAKRVAKYYAQKEGVNL